MTINRLTQSCIAAMPVPSSALRIVVDLSGRPFARFRSSLVTGALERCTKCFGRELGRIGAKL